MMNPGWHRPGDYSSNDSSFQWQENFQSCPQYNGTNFPAAHSNWQQYSSSPRLRDYNTPPSSLEQPCRFHREVLDECYQSRFWGRALEFYLLENEQHGPTYRCLMVSCPERDFKDSKAMLRHLKHCVFFPEGKFLCPTCHQGESFKVVSKSKCMWSKVNILRKLYQEALKALKVFQRISGNHEKPPYYQDRGMLQNNTFRNSQSWLAELQDTAKIHELYDARQSSYVGNLEAYRHLSCNRASIPEADSHQLSPSEPSSASSGHSGSFPSDISPTSATLTSESPVLGHFPLPPGGVETNLQSFPTMGQVYQASRDREVPSPSVNTTRSIADMPSEWINMDRMLLNPEETLGSPTDINNLMLPDLLSIPSAQINEIPQLDTYTVNESFISPDNIHLQSSPSTSVPSYSNYELSPSSMSSGPELMRCTYPGCVFEPNGKPENRRAYMRKHLKSHQKIEIPCKVCGKTFTRQDNLTNHMHKKHTDVNESPSKRRRSLESLLSAGQPRRKESRRDVCGII